MGKLHLMLGRSGSGKTTKLLDKLCVQKGERPQIVMTSDQNSHEMERRLCLVGGDDISLFAECLTFGRMSDRIFMQTGGQNLPELDRGGQILLMHRSVQSSLQKLKSLHKSAKYASFCEELLKISDELKSCSVLPKALFDASNGLPAQDKLQEIALICDFYNQYIQNIGFDPKDRLTRASLRLKQCDYASGCDVWVDGFSYFTPQQLGFLREIIKQANSVTVALTTAEGETTAFAQGERSRLQLLQLGSELGISAEIEEIKSDFNCRNLPLTHLEANLYAENQHCYTGELTDEIKLYNANSIRSEVEWTASEILTLVREKGYRFREIAVVARDYSPYQHLVESVFHQYKIPVFSSKKTSILEKPVLLVVVSGLDVMSNGYRYDDVFRYLKTGLHPITDHDRDLLENYVLLWNIRGNQWTDKDWTYHPDGFGAEVTEESTERLEYLNNLRQFVMLPLQHFVEKSTNSEDKSLVLYELLEEIELYEQIELRRQGLIALEQKAEAEEYRQLWEILCNGLEQCHNLLSKSTLTMEEFSKIFQLVLSQYDVSSIPVSLDQVMAGETIRLKANRVRVIFWLGAEDSTVPTVPKSGGLITDEDRVGLEGESVALSENSEELLFYELSSIYEICSLATERLCVSYPRHKAGGEQTRPSFLIERIATLFPSVTIEEEEQTEGKFRLSAPLVAVEQIEKFDGLSDILKEKNEFLDKIERFDHANMWGRGSLSSEGVVAVFGDKIPLSASKIDKFSSCHFAYFMEYGLRAKPRKEAVFSSAEYGIFVHYVLEHVLRLKMEGTLGDGDDGREQAMEKIIVQYTAEQLRDGHKTPRERYLFERLSRGVKTVVRNALDELSVSQFQPHSLELKFSAFQGDLPPIKWKNEGISIQLTGVVDRVDCWESGDKLYLRLIDYKTGRKPFDLNDVLEGRNLQLLIYLFALKRLGNDHFQVGERMLEGAGVSYFPAREIVVKGSRTMSEQALQKAVQKELVQSGVFLSKSEVLEALERSNDGNYRFLPLATVKKTGAVKGKGLVSDTQLVSLEEHIGGIFDKICAEFEQGKILADPYWNGTEENACKFCHYVEACHFEEGRGGDCKRYRKKRSEEEILSIISQKKEG